MPQVLELASVIDVERLVTRVTTAPTMSMYVENVTVLDNYIRCFNQLVDIATLRRYLEVTGRRSEKLRLA